MNWKLAVFFKFNGTLKRRAWTHFAHLKVFWDGFVHQSDLPAFFLSPASHLLGFANLLRWSTAVFHSTSSQPNHSRICLTKNSGLANSNLQQAGIGKATISNILWFDDARKSTCYIWKEDLMKPASRDERFWLVVSQNCGTFLIYLPRTKKSLKVTLIGRIHLRKP